MKISSYLYKTIQYLGIVCLLIMVGLVFSNAVLRYAFSMGIAFSEELSRICFVYLIFFGIVLVAKDRSHLTVDILITNLNSKIKKILRYITDIIVLIACIFMVIGASNLFTLTLDLSMPATGFSQSILYFACIFSFTIYAIILALDLLKGGNE